SIQDHRTGPSIQGRKVSYFIRTWSSRKPAPFFSRAAPPPPPPSPPDQFEPTDPPQEDHGMTLRRPRRANQLMASN
ncbi:hypothetical protein ACHAWF_018538, partial [Thalassiosira exigua]